MPVRSIFRALPLFLGFALAACGTDVNQAYTTPAESKCSLMKK